MKFYVTELYCYVNVTVEVRECKVTFLRFLAAPNSEIEPVLSVLEQPDFRRSDMFAFRCRVRNLKETEWELALAPESLSEIMTSCYSDDDFTVCDYRMRLDPRTRKVYCGHKSCSADKTTCETLITLKAVSNGNSVD